MIATPYKIHIVFELRYRFGIVSRQENTEALSVPFKIMREYQVCFSYMIFLYTEGEDIIDFIFRILDDEFQNNEQNIKSFQPNGSPSQGFRKQFLLADLKRTTSANLSVGRRNDRNH